MERIVWEWGRSIASRFCRAVQAKHVYVAILVSWAARGLLHIHVALLPGSKLRITSTHLTRIKLVF
jgi:hypothetical protein